VFATCYDVDLGRAVEVGTQEELLREIEATRNHADRLKAKYTSTTCKPRHRANLERTVRLLNYRVHNKVHSFHRRFIANLVRSYDVIVVGDWCASNKGKTRGRLARSTQRNMRHWAHGAFKTRLMQRAAGDEEYGDGTRVVIPDERWTSKTCTRCAYLKRDLGAAKTYECNRCGLVLDRDVNGAMNICKRYLFSLK
jgi:putative transposase